MASSQAIAAGAHAPRHPVHFMRSDHAATARQAIDAAHGRRTKAGRHETVPGQARLGSAAPGPAGPAGLDLRPRPSRRAVARAPSSPVRSLMRRRSASLASGSPCTTKVWRGGWRRPRSQAISSSRIGMAREAFELAAPSARTGTYSPWILTSRGAAHQPRAAAAADLEAGEDDVVLGHRRHGLQVVQHAPAGGHAAGRDDDAGPARSRQPHRLLRRRPPCARRRPGGRPRAPARAAAGGACGTARWPRWPSGCPGRPAGRPGSRRRAFRRCSTSISACARPTAKAGSSTEPPRCTVSRDDLRQLRRRVVLGVDAVAVGRFDQQHVGVAHAAAARASAGRRCGPRRPRTPAARSPVRAASPRRRPAGGPPA